MRARGVAGAGPSLEGAGPREPQVARRWRVRCPPHRSPLFWVPAQAGPRVPFAAASTCRGDPRDGRGGSRPRCGSSLEPFLRTSLGDLDLERGAARSDPAGAGEGERAGGLASAPGRVPGSRRFCPHAAASGPGHQ